MIRRTALKLHNSIGHSHTHRFVHSYQATQRNQHLASISKQIEASNMKALDIIKQNNAALSSISDQIKIGNELLNITATQMLAANEEHMKYLKEQTLHNKEVRNNWGWSNLWLYGCCVSLICINLNMMSSVSAARHH